MPSPLLAPFSIKEVHWIGPALDQGTWAEQGPFISRVLSDHVMGVLSPKPARDTNLREIRKGTKIMSTGKTQWMERLVGYRQMTEIVL